jgi:hypothetical protein
LNTPEYCAFLIALIQGQGHTWDFNASATNDLYLYSSKGLGPASQSGLTRNTASAVYGAAGLKNGPTGEVTWDVGFLFEWTAMFWKTDSLGANGVHYIINSQGQKWVDGIRNDGTSTTFFDLTAGILTLGTNDGSTHYFDDLVVIEADITEAWAVDFGTASSAFGEMPKFIARGDMLDDHRYSVEAFDVSTKYVQGFMDGTWYPNLQEVTFTMHEFNRES